MKIITLSEDCLILELQEGISEEASQKVFTLFEKCKQKFPFANNIVPAYNSIAVYFNPIKNHPKEIKLSLQEIYDDYSSQPTQKKIKGKLIKIPTEYNGDDLDNLCQIHSLNKKEIIKLHSEQIYTIACIGFLPHFPYLIGLNPKLHTPRKKSPSLKVPAGSIAIGGKQTGIYPCDSPGGWHLIGKIQNLNILKKLSIGQQIKFTLLQ